MPPETTESLFGKEWERELQAIAKDLHQSAANMQDASTEAFIKALALAKEAGSGIPAEGRCESSPKMCSAPAAAGNDTA